MTTTIKDPTTLEPKTQRLNDCESLNQAPRFPTPYRISLFVYVFCLSLRPGDPPSRQQRAPCLLVSVLVSRPQSTRNQQTTLRAVGAAPNRRRRSIFTMEDQAKDVKTSSPVRTKQPRSSARITEWVENVGAGRKHGGQDHQRSVEQSWGTVLEQSLPVDLQPRLRAPDGARAAINLPDKQRLPAKLWSKTLKRELARLCAVTPRDMAFAHSQLAKQVKHRQTQRQHREQHAREVLVGDIRSTTKEIKRLIGHGRYKTTTTTNLKLAADFGRWKEAPGIEGSDSEDDGDEKSTVNEASQNGHRVPTSRSSMSSKAESVSTNTVDREEARRASDAMHMQEGHEERVEAFLRSLRED